MRTGIFLLTLLLAGAAFSQEVSIGVSLAEAYAQGDEGRVQMDLLLEDPEGTISQGVWFLNIVEPLGGGEVRQVMHLLFDRARESGDSLRAVYSHDELTGGLTAIIDFRIGRRAPPGDYLLAVQLYRGTNTNPGRMIPEDRMAMEFFPLKVLPRTD